MATHVLRAAGLVALALALAACPRPSEPPRPAAGARRVLADAPVTPAVHRVLEAVPAKRPAPLDGPLIPERAVDLIVSFEVGSPEAYERKYKHPVWPGAASGVTIGIGYDLGHRAPNVIALDWEAHPHAVRLSTASGVTGPIAREHARRLADLSVEWRLARQVFDQTSVVEHYRQARRAFGQPFADAHPNVQGALTSLVFNRGQSMAGERRREMRTIRDVCLPAQDRACVARELRAMVRVWRGGTIERGMERRRLAEAALAEAA